MDRFVDDEGNTLDFIADEAVDIAEAVTNAAMVDREWQTEVKTVSDLLDEIENISLATPVTTLV